MGIVILSVIMHYRCSPRIDYLSGQEENIVGIIQHGSKSLNQTNIWSITTTPDNFTLSSWYNRCCRLSRSVRFFKPGTRFLFSDTNHRHYFQTNDSESSFILLAHRNSASTLKQTGSPPRSLDYMYTDSPDNILPRVVIPLHSTSIPPYYGTKDNDLKQHA